MDITADDHIKMQSTFQEYADNSISKTINFPHSATREDVKQGYIMAWEQGLKGCTVYRDGSRQEQVLNLHKEEKGTGAKRKSNRYTPKNPEIIVAENNEKNFEEVIPPPVMEAREHASLNKDVIKSRKCLRVRHCPNCRRLRTVFKLWILRLLGIKGVA